MDPKRILPALALAMSLGAVLTGQATGQCILANPSFEIGGSGGPTFGGWNQFGVVGSVTQAFHGFRAARVSGPNYGGWDVSGYWQSQDSEPGERWEATGHVMHPSGKPLTGQSVALVNIEWRTAGGDLIDYDSFTVADAASPADEYLDFSVVSEPAPAGTAAARLLLGVLQSPSDPSPDVYYDQVTFYSTSPPTIDDVQWNDFPGGRTVSFAGRTWRVKGPGVYGPGINYFCNASDCVWVDASDRLHLTLKNRSGTWSSTEVVAEEALGYGDYILTTVGRLDQIDPQAVLGIFLWQYGPCWDESYLWWNAFNEIDIEYSRWGDPGNSIAQFVAQPYNSPGNIDRFDATFGEGELTSHAMRWQADRIEYRVWRGGPQDESPASTIHAWTYTGPHIPRPEQPRMHLNLWKLEGPPAANQEVVFDNFTFISESLTHVADGSDGWLPAVPGGRLYPAAPNPFNPQTVVRYDLVRDGFAELAVYDLGGHLVRTLSSGFLTAGEHRATWDGRDDADRALASGIYLFRLRGHDFVESQRVTLIK
jgi:hypothetical protein